MISIWISGKITPQIGKIKIMEPNSPGRSLPRSPWTSAAPWPCLPSAWPGMGCARWRPANSRPGGQDERRLSLCWMRGSCFAGSRCRRSRRSLSRSACWGSMGWRSTTSRRHMPCGLLAGAGLLGAAAYLHHVSQACRGSGRGWTSG